MSRTGQRYKLMSRSRRKDRERMFSQPKNQGVPFVTNGRGAICEYCKRELEPTTSTSELRAVREHLMPRSRGGRKRVWACHKCDVIKGDKTTSEWTRFMSNFPRWWLWKIFRNE